MCRSAQFGKLGLQRFVKPGVLDWRWRSRVAKQLRKLEHFRREALRRWRFQIENADDLAVRDQRNGDFGACRGQIGAVVGIAPNVEHQFGALGADRAGDNACYPAASPVSVKPPHGARQPDLLVFDQADESGFGAAQERWRR